MRHSGRFSSRGIQIATALVLSSLFAIPAVLTGPLKMASATCSQAIYNGYYAINAHSASTFAPIDLNGASTGVGVTLPNSSASYDITTSPDGSKMYIAGSSGYISVFNTATNSVSQIAIGGTNTSWSVVFNSTGTTAYASDYTAGQLEVIDVATSTITTSITLPAVNSSAIAIRPDDSQVWVRFNYVDGVAIVDTATNTVLDASPGTAGTQLFFAGNTASTVSSGQGIAFNPTGTRAVLSNFMNGTISLVDVVNMAMIDVNGASAGLNTATTGAQTVRRVMFSPDGERIFALHTGSTALVRVFTSDLSSYADITGLSHAIDMAFLPNGRIAVGNYSNNYVAIFESSGGSSTWGGTFSAVDTDSTTAGTQNISMSSTVYALEYGCANTVLATTTTAATTTTTTAVTTTTSSSTTSTTPTTSTTTVSPATTAPSSNTTVVAGSTSTTQPTPMNTAPSTSVAANSASSTSTTTTISPTTTAQSPTLNPEEVEQLIGVSSEEANSISNEVEKGDGAVVLVNGKITRVDVATTLSSVTLKHAGATLEVKCFDSAGIEIGLSGESRFVLRRGDTVQLSITGFAPKSEVNAAVFSTPLALGTLKADANGNGSQKWIVPNSVEAGNHTLMIAGDLAEVENTVFGLRIIVDQKSLVSRVAGSWVTRFILLFGVILGFFIPATVRRRRNDA